MGQCAGMSMYTSLRVPNVSTAKYKVIAGHPSAVQLVEKVINVKRYDDIPYTDTERGDGVGVEVRGEYLFGFQQAKPYLSMIIANPA